MQTAKIAGHFRLDYNTIRPNLIVSYLPSQKYMYIKG